MHQRDFGHLDLAGRALDLDLGHRGDIGAHQLVLAVADAAAGDHVARLVVLGGRALVPLRQLRHPFEHLDAAFVGRVEILHSERQRICLRRRRELVDEAFVRKRVLHASRRADPGRAERCGLEPAADGLHVGEFVRDRRVLEDVAGSHIIARRHLRKRGGDQRHVEAVGRLLRNEEFRLPGRDVAGAVHGGAQVDERRRALGVPAMLVGARPLHAHRLPDRFRQQRRVRRCILVAVAAIAAGALDVEAAHLVRRDRRHGGEVPAQGVGHLRGGPAGERPVLDLRDGAGRPDGAVGVDGEVVGGLEGFGIVLGARQRVGRVADVAGDLVLEHLRRAHVVPELGGLWQRLRFRPGGLELLCRLYRTPFALRDHAEEIALAHDPDDPHDILDRAFVDALELGTEGRGPNNASVQHAGHAEVLHVGEASRHLVGNVDARHRLSHEPEILGVLAGRGLGRIELERKRLATDERAVADAFVAGADDAIGDLQFVLGDAEAFGCLVEQRGLGGRCGVAQLHAADLHREAAPRLPLIRRERGVSLDQLDRAERDVELVGDDLRQRGCDAGAEIDLTGIDRHQAPGIDGEKRIDLGERQRFRCGALRRGRVERATEREADDEGACALEHIAAGGMNVHGRLPFTRWPRA